MTCRYSTAFSKDSPPSTASNIEQAGEVPDVAMVILEEAVQQDDPQFFNRPGRKLPNRATDELQRLVPPREVVCARCGLLKRCDICSCLEWVCSVCAATHVEGCAQTMGELRAFQEVSAAGLLDQAENDPPQFVPVRDPATHLAHLLDRLNENQLIYSSDSRPVLMLL